MPLKTKCASCRWHYKSQNKTPCQAGKRKVSSKYFMSWLRTIAKIWQHVVSGDVGGEKICTQNTGNIRMNPFEGENIVDIFQMAFDIFLEFRHKNAIRLEKLPPYGRLFSSFCGGLQPLATNGGVLRAQFCSRFSGRFF